MRRRFQVPLYTEHPGHLDVIEHLMQFNSAQRGRELALLVQAGYQSLYGNTGSGQAPLSVISDENERLMQLMMQGVARGSQAPPPASDAESRERGHLKPESGPPRPQGNPRPSVESSSSPEAGQVQSSDEEKQSGGSENPDDSRAPMGSSHDPSLVAPAPPSDIAGHDESDLQDVDPAAVMEAGDEEDEIPDPLAIFAKNIGR